MPDWPHAPIHRIVEPGTYFITGATYLKEHHFRSSKRLDWFTEQMMRKLEAADVNLEAWAIFSNHYHLVLYAPDAIKLKSALHRLHQAAGFEINKADGVKGRQVMYEYWDTQLTIQGSYLARLKYVPSNAVHHRLVRIARDYPWCSAGWFQRNAPLTFQKILGGVKIDQIEVDDDFNPALED